MGLERCTYLWALDCSVPFGFQLRPRHCESLNLYLALYKTILLSMRASTTSRILVSLWALETPLYSRSFSFANAWVSSSLTARYDGLSLTRSYLLAKSHYMGMTYRLKRQLSVHRHAPSGSLASRKVGRRSRGQSGRKPGEHRLPNGNAPLWLTGSARCHSCPKSTPWALHHCREWFSWSRIPHR